MHVPPRRFVHQALRLLCSRTKSQKLTLCRNLLGCKKYLSKLRDMEMPEILEHLYGIKVCVCKACGGHLGKPQMRMPLQLLRATSNTFKASVSEVLSSLLYLPVFYKML